MITSITVENFQSIARARLDLGAWTSLVGESDTGKSAIVRALYALLTNQRGDQFVRHGEQAARVSVTLDDGTRIDWRKARGSSGAYLVTTADGGETLYEKTGSEVPADVRALLRMTVAVGGDEFMPGFQRQHDAPFLFADSPRRRAQVLGEFDGSNLLLLADGAIRRRQRAAQQRAAAQHEVRAQAEQSLAALDWIPAAEDAYTSAAQALERYADANAALDAGRVLRTMLTDARAEVLAHMTTLDGARALDRVDVDALADANAALDAVRVLRMALTDARAEVLAHMNTLDAARAIDRVDVDALAGALAALTAARDLRAAITSAHALAAASEAAARVTVQPLPDLDAQIQRIGVLRTLHQQVERAQAAARVAYAATVTAEAEAEAAAAALAALAGEPCPVCGQPLAAADLAG